MHMASIQTYDMLRCRARATRSLYVWGRPLYLIRCVCSLMLSAVVFGGSCPPQQYDRAIYGSYFLSPFMSLISPSRLGSSTRRTLVGSAPLSETVHSECVEMQSSSQRRQSEIAVRACGSGFTVPKTGGSGRLSSSPAELARIDHRRVAAYLQLGRGPHCIARIPIWRQCN